MNKNRVKIIDTENSISISIKSHKIALVPLRVLFIGNSCPNYYGECIIYFLYFLSRTKTQLFPDLQRAGNNTNFPYSCYSMDVDRV